MNLALAFLILAQLYMVVLSVAGFLPARRFGAGPGRRFLVFVPAHNEERVVHRAVNSLLSQRYRGAWRVVVVADRCTDATAATARALGAEVWERTAGRPGKQWAMLWALERAAGEQWDALAVVDADNVAAPNLLAELDGALVWYPAAQAYLDTLNPWGSEVAAGYAAMYLQANVFSQRSRTRAGLSSLLAGTGWAIQRGALTAAGWPTATLVDDLELTVRLVLRGRRVAFVESTRVWDEKPIRWWASIRQRARWTRGHLQCGILYAPRLAWRLVRHLDMAAWDMLAVLLMPWLVAFGLVSLFINGGWLYWLLWSFLMTAAGAVLTRRPARELLLGVALPAFSLTWLPAMAWGLLTVWSGAWEHTSHG